LGYGFQDLDGQTNGHIVTLIEKLQQQKQNERGSAPLDSVTVGGGIRFDGSLVAGMDETSVWLDDSSGGRSQGLLHQKPSYIDIWNTL
jgi:hypothetical protein